MQLYFGVRLALAKRVGQEEETGAKQTHAVFGPKCFLYREGFTKGLPRRIPSEHYTSSQKNTK